jgi:hypothetical protein
MLSFTRRLGLAGATWRRRGAPCRPTAVEARCLGRSWNRRRVELYQEFMEDWSVKRYKSRIVVYPTFFGGRGIFHILTDFCEKIELPITIFLCPCFSPSFLPFSIFLLTIQGDLGAIDEQYDVAISTACGALDNIIVDTMDTAVQCVDFLRKQDVGVATFIGLDKMERWKREAHGKITTYGKIY